MQRAVHVFMRALQDARPGVSEKAIKSGSCYAIALMLLIIFAEAGILALAEADRAVR